MNNKRNRRIAMIVAVLMLTMAFSSTGFAALMTKTMEVSYRNISIWVNGEYKQSTDANGEVVEPFIYEGTTYVPLRGISEMLGYNVSFNNYRIDITGNVAGNSAALEYQLLIKDARIAELEAQLAEKQSSSVDLDDLEDELNEDFTEFDTKLDVDDIFLDGDEDDIEVEIYLDASDDNDDFDYWYATIDDYDDDIIDFLQDVVDDILDEYEDADITGFIGFEEDDDTYVEFTIDSRGDVDLDGSSSGLVDFGDLEKELDDDFDELDGVEFSYSVEEEDDDELYILIESDSYDITKEIDEDDMIDFLEDMARTIDDYVDFEDYYVYGDIEDDKGYLEFEYDENEDIDYLEWY